MIDRTFIAAHFEDLRKSLGISLEKAEDEMHLSRKTLSKFVESPNAEYQPDTIDTIIGWMESKQERLNQLRETFVN